MRVRDQQSNSLRGIVEFEGTVTVAAAAKVGTLAVDGPVACVGMDQAVVDLVPDLVAQGCDVRLFIDRPLAVMPDHLVPHPRRADVAMTLATGWRTVMRHSAGLPVPAVVRQVVGEYPRRLDRLSADYHRRRWLRESWRRREMTPRDGGQGQVLRSDDFYRALGEANCRVVSWPIARVIPTGIRTCDGLEHHLTAIVVAR